MEQQSLGVGAHLQTQREGGKKEGGRERREGAEEGTAYIQWGEVKAKAHGSAGPAYEDGPPSLASRHA